MILIRQTYEEQKYIKFPFVLDITKWSKPTKYYENSKYTGRQLGHFIVRRTAVKSAEDVDCASFAVLVVGPDHDGVAVDRHGEAEGVIHRQAV